MARANRRRNTQLATTIGRPKKTETELPSLHEATDEEWVAIVDRAARHYLHMSGAEFARQWEAGEFDDPDRHEVMSVALLLPDFERRRIAPS